jgi:hypothetical protein
MLGYLCESRTWVEKVLVKAHNAKAFDLHFVLNRAILLKWQLEGVMKGMEIMRMSVEHLVFLDSVSFLPFPLRKLPEAFGLTFAKSCYPDYFTTPANMNYVGKSMTYHIMA